MYMFYLAYIIVVVFHYYSWVATAGIFLINGVWFIVVAYYLLQKVGQKVQKTAKKLGPKNYRNSSKNSNSLRKSTRYTGATSELELPSLDTIGDYEYDIDDESTTSYVNPLSSPPPTYR